MSLFLPFQQKIEAHRAASTAIPTGNPFQDLQLRRAAATKTARSLAPKPVFKPLVNPGSLVRKAVGLRHQLVPASVQAAQRCQSVIWPCDRQQSPVYHSATQTKTAATAGAKAVIEATMLQPQAPASTGSQHSGNTTDPAQTLLEMQEQGTAPLATQSKPKIAGGGIGGLILLGLVAGGFLLSKSSSSPKASLNGPAKSKAIQINL